MQKICLFKSPRANEQRLPFGKPGAPMNQVIKVTFFSPVAGTCGSLELALFKHIVIQYN